MVVEVAVLGCERDLDHRVRKILKRDRSAMVNRPATNRIADLIKQTRRNVGNL